MEIYLLNLYYILMFFSTLRIVLGCLHTGHLYFSIETPIQLSHRHICPHSQNKTLGIYSIHTTHRSV